MEEEGVMDPYWEVGDEQLEQLWLESQATSQEVGCGDVRMEEDEAGDDGFDDPAFEEALASLPY